MRYSCWGTGPSWKTIEQIPDLSIFYVRFIARYSIYEDPDDGNHTKGSEKNVKQKSAPHTSTSTSGRSPLKRPRLAEPSPEKFYPHSLSVSDMIKLGKRTKSKATTVVSMYKLDMEILSWSKVPTTVEFNEEDKPFGLYKPDKPKPTRQQQSIPNLEMLHG